MTPGIWHPLDGSPEPMHSVVVGGWRYTGPVIGHEWRQATASFHKDWGWVLDETGSYASDGFLSFIPTHYLVLPEPPIPHP